MKCDHEASVVRTKKASSYQSQTWHYIRRHIYDRAQQLIREIFHRVQITAQHFNTGLLPIFNIECWLCVLLTKNQSSFPKLFYCVAGIEKAKKTKTGEDD